MEQTLTIGKLAKAAGVGVETVRYYHRCGLLPVPERAHGAIRQYSQQSLQRMHFIRQAQSLGFTLDEIRGLLQQKHGRCSTARALAERKLSLVEERLRDLRGMRAELKILIGQCHANGTEDCCPLMNTLSANGNPENGRAAALRGR
ncbi:MULTISPECIES: MerR family transcriptional regulator [Cupriavidus]|uniref:Mercuric resistance operon regulatory protein n=1 Tax=Cupriavidus oxalaticus TaxID=96344 RepID=A0A4P7L6Z2_9BURK|nr:MULTISPECIES: MerR family transcriptional regulator [Cupriavidus]MBF6988310.1 MerR family DNA-binding protein [Cupriavidus sp. IK-TO18]QBY50985.1 MerR family transcriptional regulator [Cupriavidus oxalaticus]TDF66746.1 MerR family transcriptional regulator [Cupriavidus sp. L7L]